MIERFLFELFNVVLKPFRRKGQKDPYHAVFSDFLDAARQRESPRILEIGSRNVTGVTRRDLFGQDASYTGFDIVAGENVDVVGDVHKLSSSVEPDSFDLVFAVSVFEHVLMPWKAILEINRILKQGGLFYMSTHQTWPPHEKPWDFWRFSADSIPSLFNTDTGFKLVRAEEGLPCRIVSLSSDRPTSGIFRTRSNLGVAVLARKVSEPNPDLKWDVACDDVVATSYPAKA